jgi:hypothetical protein
MFDRIKSAEVNASGAPDGWTLPVKRQYIRLVTMIRYAIALFLLLGVIRESERKSL